MTSSKTTTYLLITTVLLICFAATVSAQQPNLAVTKTVSANNVLNGSNFTYTITITNNGDANATNITVFETLDSNANTVLVAQPTSENVSVNGTWVIAGELAAGNSTNVNITVLVNAAVANATVLNNTVAVHYNSSNETGTPNIYVSNASVTNTVIAPPALTVTKTESADPIGNGSTLIYTITVENTGGVTARNVTIFETFNNNITFVSASPAANLSATNTSWFLNNLAPGATATVNITMLVNGTIVNGTLLNNSVAVHYNMSDISTSFISNASITTTVVAQAPAITITKTATPNPSTGAVTYTLTVTNTGVANNLVINDNLSTHLFLGSILTDNPFNYTAHTIIWHINLSVYDRFQANYTVNAVRSGQLTNNASIIFDNGSITVTLNASTTTIFNLNNPTSGGSPHSGGSSGGSSSYSSYRSSSSTSTGAYDGGYESAAASQGLTGLGETTSSSGLTSTSSTSSASASSDSAEGSTEGSMEDTQDSFADQTGEDTSEAERMGEESESEDEGFSLSFPVMLILLLIVLALIYVAYKNYPRSEEKPVNWKKK